MLKLSNIVSVLGGVIQGKSDIEIQKVGSLAHGQSGAIGFFNDGRYTDMLANTALSAVIIRQEHVHLTQLPAIVVDDPRVYFAKACQLINPKALPKTGIHASAVIGERCAISESTSIQANVVISDDVSIGENVCVGAGSVIENNVTILEGSIIEPNVTIKSGTKIGEGCHLYSGSVIGNDGFGYAEGSGKWVKVPQVGNVVLGNQVDIGSNTTVDRGAIDDTVIEEGVKIDNLVQIGHNCLIGAHTVIAGCVGVAGSARIGKHCKVGGAAMILGHLTIADDVTISPGSMVISSIEKSGKYTALMPLQEHQAWVKTAVNIKQLNRTVNKQKTVLSSMEALKTKLDRE